MTKLPVHLVQELKVGTVYDKAVEFIAKMAPMGL